MNSLHDETMPGKARLLLTATSVFAMMMAAPAAFAQDGPTEPIPTPAESSADDVADDEDDDEVVATGIRQALSAARDLKRNADTAVDSITASDVSSKRSF